MRTIITSTLICALFLLSIPSFSFAQATTSEEMLRNQLEALTAYQARLHRNEKPLSDDELRSSIQASIEWFRAAQESNGHFRYEYLPFEGKYRNDDNIVRQAGSLYALGEVRRRTKSDVYGVDPLIEKSISYLDSITKKGSLNGKPFACVTKGARSSRCALGATSLTLVGMLAYIEAYPEKEKTYGAQIAAYRSFILMQQKENGGFKNLYAFTGTAPDTESAFSNGEALLALVRAYMHTPDPSVKAAIDHAFTHLKRQPYDGNLYLWMMAALMDMERLWPSDTYRAYAYNFTLWKIHASKRVTSGHNYCPYAEGIASAVGTLKVNPNSYNAALFETELERRNAYHRGLQLAGSEKLRASFHENTFAFYELKNPEVAHGGFLTGENEPTQRIDFTQHCMNTYVQTLEDVRGKSL